TLAEYQKVGQRVSAEPVRSMQSAAAFTRSEKTGNGRHLSFGVNANATHDVVRSRPDFHRRRCNVDIRELLELVIHAGQLALDVLCRVGHFFFDPRNIEIHPSGRPSPPRFNLTHNASRDVIAGEQFRRTASGLVSLAVFPSLEFVVGSLSFISVRDVIKHESLAGAVPQDTAFAPNPFGDQDTGDTRGPYHTGGMELHE